MQILDVLLIVWTNSGWEKNIAEGEVSNIDFEKTYNHVD